MNFVVNTGNVQRDHEEIARYQQHYRGQGLEVYAQPLASGGFQITVAPARQPAAAPAQPQYPAPAAQPYGAPQHGGTPQQYGGAPQQYGAPGPQQYGAAGA